VTLRFNRRRSTLNPYAKKDLKSFLSAIPQDVIDFQMDKQHKEANEFHNKFVRLHKRGKCALCNHSESSVIDSQPCLHWLLLPDGIRKSQLVRYLNGEVSLQRLESYLRWIANTENFISNVNDLNMDKQNDAIINITIRYKDLEWSLYMSQSDYDGHDDKHSGASPHYHVQILRCNLPYLDFSQSHVKLSDEDLFNMELEKQNAGLFRIDHTTYGEGFSELERFDDSTVQHLDAILKTTDNPSEATINRTTIIQSSIDNPITDEMIREAISTNKETHEPIGRILERMAGPGTQTKTILSLPDERLQIKTRKKRKKLEDLQTLTQA